MKNRKKNLIQLWKNKGQILEGIKNNIFKSSDVEEVAMQRMYICKTCFLFDESGEGCLVPGTGPCCDERKGGCGCSLKLKQRALSSECPKGLWKQILNEQEEDLLNDSLKINEGKTS